MSLRFKLPSLEAAVEGLHAECEASKNSPSRDFWTELIHHYVVLFCGPNRSNDRVQKVWNEVEKNLKQAWSLTELADIRFLSTKHLRRLYKKQFVRSLKQHLAFQRMKVVSSQP